MINLRAAGNSSLQVSEADPNVLVSPEGRVRCARRYHGINPSPHRLGYELGLSNESHERLRLRQ
jgi:hypothetical protein